MHKRLDWDDLRYYLAAIQAGTYSAAADMLKVNRTTIGRRIQHLEHCLGAPLFELSSSGYHPTELGKIVLATAEQMEWEMDRLMSNLSQEPTIVRGTLRICTPLGLGPEFMPQLAQFGAQYPEVHLEITNTSDPIAAVSSRKADIAIALCNDLPQHLCGERVTILERGIYGSRGYLQQIPAARDLNGHQWVGWGGEMSNSLSADWMRSNLSPGVKVTARVNSWQAMKEAVLAGFGLGHLWCFLADKLPDLYPLRREVPGLRMGLWLLRHEDVPPPPAMKACFDMLPGLMLQKIGSGPSTGFIRRTSR